jgi:hypothetical protein
MRDFLLMAILMLPSVLIAIKSKSGSNAGFYVLYIWLANACIYGFSGVIYFIFGAVIFVLIAFIFREKLEMNKWWSSKLNKK